MEQTLLSQKSSLQVISCSKFINFLNIKSHEYTVSKKNGIFEGVILRTYGCSLKGGNHCEKRQGF